jgi:hypothetical protein
MRANVAGLCLSVLLASLVCSAQNAPQAAPTSGQPDASTIYCSGFYSDQKVSDELRLISGEQSNYKITFAQGDYVYISRGQNQGIKEGDRFSVVRPVTEPLEVPWFKWQLKLMKAMGTAYEDTGQVRVVKVHPNVAIAQVSFSCGPMLRGDIVRPFEERPSPPYKDAVKFDHFAPVSGKPVAMVVAARGFHELAGKNEAIYVNLGTSQGVKVGDYFRVFRYEGSTSESAPQTKGYQYAMYGYGSAPKRYEWNDLPRELLGEGIVLNASHNSSTVMITFNSVEIYTGDYVELE